MIGLYPAIAMPAATPAMLASAKGALNTRPGKALDRPASDTEDAALRIGDVLTPHDDLRIAAHFFAKTVIDGIDHRHRLFRQVVRPHFHGRRLIGIDVRQQIARCRLRMAVRFGGGLIYLHFDGSPEGCDLVGAQHAVADEVALGSEIGSRSASAASSSGERYFR